MGEGAVRFLEAVSPHIAVISVGEKGVYALPSPRTSSLLDRFGIDRYETVRSGAIRLISDGEGVRVKAWRGWCLALP